MDSDHDKSETGDSGLSELTGDVDFISLSGLEPHYNFFCKRPLPESIADTHYLHDIIGDTEIRKGEGMELRQLIPCPRLPTKSVPMQPFDVDILKEAFNLLDAGPIDLPPSERGTPTIAGKSKDKEKMPENDMVWDGDKHIEHKKHKLWHRHRSKDNDKERRKEKSGYSDCGSDYSSTCYEKKRKHDEDEDEDEDDDDDSYGHSET